MPGPISSPGAEPSVRFLGIDGSPAKETGIEDPDVLDARGRGMVGLSPGPAVATPVPTAGFRAVTAW